MNRQLFVLAGIILLSGCVSSSKYEKLSAEKDHLQRENAVLQQSVQRQQEKNAALKESSAASDAQYEALVEGLADVAISGSVKIGEYKNMLTVDVADKILFAPGEASLKPQGKDVLLKLGAILKKTPGKLIRVVGHTDNIAPKKIKAKYPTNWELSAARSTTVVRFLQEKAGVDPTLLIVSGRGQYAPVAPNDTAANRAKNRNIEIMLLDRALVENMERRQLTDSTTDQAPTPTPQN